MLRRLTTSQIVKRSISTTIVTNDNRHTPVILSPIRCPSANLGMDKFTIYGLERLFATRHVTRVVAVIRERTLWLRPISRIWIFLAVQTSTVLNINCTFICVFYTSAVIIASLLRWFHICCLCQRAGKREPVTVERLFCRIIQSALRVLFKVFCKKFILLGKSLNVLYAKPSSSYLCHRISPAL